MRRDELPVTATGKVQKFKLAEILARERDAASA
jgi:acyl-coenzyme A synthetase/AMP-(fatty) acid ligase